MSEAIGCPTLTGPKNLQVWKIRIAGKLKHEKVWDTIIGLLSPGTLDTSTGNTDSWSVRDAKASSIIIVHVSDRLMLKVGELPYAKEMFDKLIKIHEETNVGVSTFYTYKCMLRLRWDGSPSTLNDHIAAISAADSKLTAMKKPVDREYLAFILLNSLPEKGAWESFCATVLNSLSPGKALSFHKIAERLAFTVTAHEGFSTSDAALEANTKQKSKELWCDLHKSIMHNTSNCQTLKEQKDRKKRKAKAKKKAKVKANRASHDSKSDDGS